MTLIVKIMSYNLNACGKYELIAVAELINQIAPDILFLQEVPMGNSLSQLSQYCNFKDCYMALTDAEDRRCAILSRRKINEIIRFEHMTHPAIGGWIKTNIGTVIIINVHLDPSSEQTRLCEVKQIFIKMGTMHHCIIAGDFNAVSDYDNYVWSRNAITRSTVKRSLFIPEYDVTETLIRDGLIDVAVNFNLNNEPTVPNTQDGTWNFINLRLDYVYVSASLESSVNAYGVINSMKAKSISDHLPLYVEIDRMG